MLLLLRRQKLKDEDLIAEESFDLHYINPLMLKEENDKVEMFGIDKFSGTAGFNTVKWLQDPSEFPKQIDC
jgi:hypothetical protein